MSGFGLALVLPVATLVFASASFGDLVDDQTLVYLWLRDLPLDAFRKIFHDNAAARRGIT